MPPTQTTVQTALRTAFLGLGSNLGDRQGNLQHALQHLAADDLQLERVSALYESAPVGPVQEQPAFFNAVAQIRTDLAPMALLRRCLELEEEMGRERRVPKGPRNIDIDLLLMEDQVLDRPELVLPHPELTRRAFALVPLVELCPTALDPRDGSLLRRHVDGLLAEQSLTRRGTLEV